MSAAPRLACRLHPTLLAAAALAVLSLAACDGRIGGPAPLVAYGPSGSSSRPAARPPAPPIESTAGAIVVRPGDTLYAVSRRTNAPLRALIDANNLHPPYALQAGQHLIVPRVRAYRVQPGDTLAAVGRRYGVGESEIAQANALSPPYALRTGEVLVLPSGPGAPVAPVAAAPVVAQAPRATSPTYGVTMPPPHPTGAAETASLPQPQQPQRAFAPSPPPPAPMAVAPAYAPAAAPAASRAPGPAHADPAAVALGPRGSVPLNGPPPPPPPPAVAAVTPGASTPMPPRPAPVAAQPASLTLTEPPPPPPEETVPSMPPARAGRFIWPVRGSIVSDYGSKPGGLQNDGINIAAPRGTPIRAADSGVVVYAGNELRGFGNLLLVKHPGGWVTAYAHAQEILVHRGQEVRRGQLVARVGSTGGVSTPQLHFEVRRGSHALNPRDYLGPQTASASP